MKNLSFILSWFLLVPCVMTGCGNNSDEGVQQDPVTKFDPPTVVEEDSSFFEFKDPVWIDVVRGETHDNGVIPVPEAVSIQGISDIKYPADGIAFKEISSPLFPIYKMIPQGRKVTLRISFESNWIGVDSLTSYSVDLSFPKAWNRDVKIQDKIDNREFTVIKHGETTYSIFLSLDELEVCGRQANTDIQYEPPRSRENFLLECHPGQNLTGSVVFTYSKDKDGQDISDESQKKSLTLHFVE
jgi:hypothetical protein